MLHRSGQGQHRPTHESSAMRRCLMRPPAVVPSPAKHNIVDRNRSVVTTISASALLRQFAQTYRLLPIFAQAQFLDCSGDSTGCPMVRLSAGEFRPHEEYSARAITLGKYAERFTLSCSSAASTRSFYKPLNDLMTMA